MTVLSAFDGLSSATGKSSMDVCAGDVLVDSSKRQLNSSTSSIKMFDHRRISSVGSTSEMSETSVDGEADSETVMLDHAYASTDSPCDSSGFLVSDLASLIENCELDTKFIESATRDTANFQHFLDDVINDSDVPADDILLGLLDDSSTQHVPTKSSSLHALSTPGGSLFSCARGSTETRLCSSVPLLASSPGFVFSTASPPGGQSGLQSQTSPIPASSGLLTSSSCLPIVTSSLSSLSQAASLADVMSYTDSVLSEDKIKDLLDWLAVGNSCSSLTDTALELGGHGGSSALEASPIEEKCDLGRQVQPEYCNSCSSVSVSHQIENGVCLLCSAAKRPIKDSDKLGQPLTFSGALSSRGAVPVSQFYKGNDSDTTVTSPAVKAAGGKRKSVCDDNTDNDNAEGCKRAKIDSSHDKKTEAVIDDSSDSARPQGRVHSAKREQTQSQTDDNNNTTTCVFDKAELKVDTSDMLGFLSNLTTGLPTDARWRSW